MQQYPFIFSDEPRHRLRRHFVFWVCWWLFSAFLYSFTVGVFTFGYLKRLPVSAVDSFFYLVPHMFVTYSLLYFVIPRLLLRGRYLASVVTVLLLFLATAAMSTTITRFVLVPLRHVLFGSPARPHPFETMFFLGLLAGLRGSITICGLAAAIKLMKHWYTEGQRNLKLQKQAVEVQLQLLKAQVHPHFLFNTLNSIYAFTQNAAPPAAKMVMGLSDMLRYMLYEGNRALVPLARDLQMVEEYMALEKVRYGNRFELHVDVPAKTDGLYIAPLLLLPLVENCFKHGISQVLDQPWLNLHVSLEENNMTLKLLNSKPPTNEAVHESGIGLENLQQRLALLYPGKHTLTVTNEPEVFIVNLKLQLDRQPTLRVHTTTVPVPAPTLSP